MGKFPVEKSIAKKKVLIKSGTFNMQDIYKKIKSKAESMDYLFVEKAQETKFSKYGQELKLDFYLDKEFDFFGKVEISIVLDFNGVSKLKNGLDTGNCVVSIEGKQVLDYKNRWGKQSFTRFLFPLYAAAKKEGFKSKYTIPIIKDVQELNEFIKGLFEEYGPD